MTSGNRRDLLLFEDRRLKASEKLDIVLRTAFNNMNSMYYREIYVTSAPVSCVNIWDLERNAEQANSAAE